MPERGTTEQRCTAEVVSRGDSYRPEACTTGAWISLWMIDLRRVAVLEEARLAAGMGLVAVERREVAGGMLARGEPGTWVNVATGLGMHGAVSDAEIEEFVAFYVSAGLEPRIEVCPFADASLVKGLASRRFVVKHFENVFFREYAASDRDLCAASTPSPLAEGIEVGRLDPEDEKGVWEYAAAVARGFSPDGEEPEAADVSLTARVVRTQHVWAYAARAEGRIVGGGAIEIPPGEGAKATALFALSVLPAYRRKGVQQALIAARLRAGAEAGGTIATISALPGVATERNARRMGFQVAYTKAVMAWPGEGLAGSRW